MKKILITGASQGIGYATALELSKRGHKVFALARTRHKLDKLVREVSPDPIIPIVSDITSEEGIMPLVNALHSYDSIDIVINNAGLLINKPFQETTIEDWKIQFDVNLLGSVRVIKSTLAKLSKGSHILNISSMGGLQGSSKFAGLSAYSSTKGALSILTECLSTEFSEKGIAVNCLCLGAVQTEMLNSAFPGYQAPVNPDEMASFIADFALTGNKFLNGQILPIALNNPS